MMNPPSEIDLNLSTSTVILNPVDSSGHQKVAGFANLINLRDEVAVTRCRRIQISQLGASTTNAISKEGMGPAIKKRWSFHSSNQISDILKEDKAMKPISSPKRRKSSGSGLARSVSDTFTLVDEVSHQDLPQISLSKEQSKGSRHVISSRQPQSQNHRHHHRRSKLVPLREAEVTCSRTRQRFMDEFLDSVEPYSSTCHQFRLRKPKSREPPAPDYLSAMPDEVLLRIFKRLPKTSLANLARTSHRFLSLIEDDSLWKRLCVMGKILDPEHLLIIMSRKPIYLRMARASIPDPDDVPSDLTSFISHSQLTHLDLSSALISPSALALIMRISPKLVKLSLEHIEITKEVFESMMSFVASIEVLNLTMCYELEAKYLVNFLTSCERLRELNLGCLKVDWGHEELTSVLKALPGTITQLNIAGFRNLLDNSHMEIISHRCPKLIELDISDSQEVKGKSIEYILRLTKLQHLGLSRCYGIEAPAYAQLANHKCLKYLDLFAVFKDSILRSLSLSLPGIEINKFPFSAIARPTVGNKRSSIWLQRVRD